MMHWIFLLDLFSLWKDITEEKLFGAEMTIVMSHLQGHHFQRLRKTLSGCSLNSLTWKSIERNILQFRSY